MKSTLISLLIALHLLGAARTVTSGEMNFARLIPETISKSAIFRQPGWCLWDPCIVNGGEGNFYLFYSRWPTKLCFDAWCTHAEIAFATATNPAGPYEFQGVALPSRGGNFWDGHSVFNTDVVCISNEFYLYYTGNRGTTNWAADRAIPASSEEWWTQRNNQRIGVAVADSPRGPWQRFDKPLLDVGPSFGQTIINVPNLVIKPDGGFRLYYKTLGEGPGKFGSGVFHYGADADNPLGPFVRYPEPMVNKNKLLPEVKKPFVFHIDDHYEWVQDGRNYAIVKDHDAPFLTPHGRSLLLFESPDGRVWKPARNPLVKDFIINWGDGEREKFNRLEMPKLLFERGRPTVLSLAALPESAKESFLVLVPLKAVVPEESLRNPVWTSADNLRDPSVLKTPDGFRIFYSRLAGKNWADTNSWSIGEVFTRDFAHFDDDRDVSPKGHASPGDVIFWGGRWLLPYQTYPATPTHLVFSESLDLKSWSAPKPFLTEARFLPWNGLKRVIDPTLVLDGDTLHCFFVGSANVTNAAGKSLRANLLGHAITRDPKLEHWEILTTNEPLLGVSERAPDGVENIMIFRTGDHWTMIFSEGLANQHLALATSKDLISWKQGGPIDIPRQKWMARKYGAPFVWREANQWLMILMGENAAGRTTFGLLTSQDGKKWSPIPE